MLKITMEMEDDAVKDNPSNITDSLVELPEPTGPHSIGTAKYDLEDVYRKDFQFPQGRLIPIQIYFPLEQGRHSIYPKIFEERAALDPFEPLNVDGHSQPTIVDPEIKQKTLKIKLVLTHLFERIRGYKSH